MDESRPVEAGARHKVLRMTFLSEFLHTGRTIVVTTGIQNVSYASIETLFFLLPHPTLYPSFTKHQWNTKFLWHATQIRAFFAKKVARGYSYSGAIVNLIRDWWGEKTTTQQAKLLHSRVFLGGGGLRVGTGAMGLETRGYRVVRWFFKKKQSPPKSEHWNSTGELTREPHYAVMGTDTSSSRLFLRLQDAPLPFFGLPWMNFTHTLSCLNCTRNLSHTETSLRISPGVETAYVPLTGINYINSSFSILLVWDVDVDLLLVCGLGPGAVEFGDDLNQMFAAE